MYLGCISYQTMVTVPTQAYWTNRINQTYLVPHYVLGKPVEGTLQETLLNAVIGQHHGQGNLS